MKQLVMGDHAVALGALKAGMDFFSGYPITPASDIMNLLAKKDIDFVHAEDEIAAFNMVIGASLAGRKVMTSSAGPGISLIQESLGLAHKIEVPMVVVNVQRMGPSTGMPTLPAQGDIIQTKYGSHGDYNPIVFYPNSVEECYKYTIEAYNASEESKSPVMLLLDGFIGHMTETVDLDKYAIKLVKRSIAPLGTSNRHFTGLLSKDNAPCTKNSAYYREWYKEMKDKIAKVADKHAYFEYVKNEKADTLLIAFGITSRVVMPLTSKYSLFRPIRIFPMLEKELIDVAKDYDKIIVIEMNDGQYAGEVQRVLKRDVIDVPMLGGDITLERVKEKLNEL